MLPNIRYSFSSQRKGSPCRRLLLLQKNAVFFLTLRSRKSSPYSFNLYAGFCMFTIKRHLPARAMVPLISLFPPGQYIPSLRCCAADVLSGSSPGYLHCRPGRFFGTFLHACLNTVLYRFPGFFCRRLTGCVCGEILKAGSNPPAMAGTNPLPAAVCLNTRAKGSFPDP